MKNATLIGALAGALPAAALTLALPALAADVRIQGSHAKVRIEGQSYHVVEKGSPLKATVKGPTDVTVMLRGQGSGSQAVTLFMDKKKLHFVDLAGGGKTQKIAVPAGSHEISVEAFGKAAVAFRAGKGGAKEESASGPAVEPLGPPPKEAKAKKGKKGKHRKAQTETPELVAEPIAPPPSETTTQHTVEATPVPAGKPAETAAATPTETATPAPSATPAATSNPDEGTLMMGEPPPKPAAEAAATPAPAPSPAPTTQAAATPAPAETKPAPEPAPAAATATTVEVEKEKPSRSSATYWLAGTSVVLAGGAAALGGLSLSQNSSYQSATEASGGTAANPSRGSMLNTANTELEVAEVVAGVAAAALATSAILAWTTW
jgi:hypothetical protein